MSGPVFQVHLRHAQNTHHFLYVYPNHGNPNQGNPEESGPQPHSPLELHSRHRRTEKTRSTMHGSNISVVLRALVQVWSVLYLLLGGHHSVAL